MLLDGPGSISQFDDYQAWWEAVGDSWRSGETIRAIVIAYYKACPVCHWADPTTHKTQEQAQAVRHACNGH